MKRVLMFPALLTAAGAIVSVASGQWWIGILCGLVAGVMAFTGTLKLHSSGAANAASNMGQEARWLLRPISQLRNELADLAKQAKGNPEVSVIAQEAVLEADEIYKRAVTMASARETIKRTLKGRGEAETNLGRLQRQYAESENPTERDALESAITARQKELATYDLAMSKASEIESKLKAAEAALSELKATLAAGVLGSGHDDSGQDELNEIMGRIKVLGQSFEESQEYLEVKSS